MKRVWIQFSRVFPSLNFSVPSSSTSSSFIDVVPRFRLPFIPPFSGGGSPSWDSNCYIMDKRGISRLSQRFWEKRNYRDSVGSCFRIFEGWISTRYIPLVGIFLRLVFVSGLLMFVPVFYSYHLAEVIYTGVEIKA